ncbi:MAG: glucan biosynthesis protein [Deltaproteobacteria bacterium]|jgi:glucans biosynthesis protein|nr:glucan biosynthesis protein [Deltaproteobacteria bacterium]
MGQKARVFIFFSLFLLSLWAINLIEEGGFYFEAKAATESTSPGQATLEPKATPENPTEPHASPKSPPTPDPKAPPEPKATPALKATPDPKATLDPKATPDPKAPPNPKAPLEAKEEPKSPDGANQASLSQPETSLTQDPPPAAPPFGFSDVETLAKTLAAQPFSPQDPKKASFIRENYGEDVFSEIRFKEENLLWADEGFFALGFCHPGSVYDQTVIVNLVENGQVKESSFRPTLFNYPHPSLSLKAMEQGLGYSGFSLYYPINSPDKSEKTLIFQGASNFQALARQANLGLTSRGLIIDPALPEGEQYPYFRRFWLVKPGPLDRAMTIYALLEAQSLTGAFAFVVKPGASLVIEVSATIFSRQGRAWPRKLGLAPVSGMYLFSEKENGSPYDWRPEVHSCDALLYSIDDKTWSHRPLNNPKRLMLSYFKEAPIVGYGLIQKDGDFDHFQDIGARYDRRAWVFVEPGEGFGAGQLELLEIPSSKEIHENVLAFWARDLSSETGARELRYDYKLYWTPPGVTPHRLGRVVANRLLTTTDPETAEFIVDFEGETLNALSAETGLASQVEPEGNFPVLDKKLFKNPVTGGWRLRFKTRSPLSGGVMESIFTGRAENWRPPRVRARLVRGENLPEPLTETFIYDFN